MNWQILQSVGQLQEVLKESESKPVFIFKHSTRCSISSTALSRLERMWDDDIDTNKLTPYYLDLIANRDVSNKIEEVLHVVHQSPQLILIKDGKSIYDTSHMGINYGELMAQAD
jgi:bacillithiol system protein YtxJ